MKFKKIAILSLLFVVFSVILISQLAIHTIRRKTLSIVDQYIQEQASKRDLQTAVVIRELGPGFLRGILGKERLYFYLNEDVSYPAASLIKLPLMACCFLAEKEGKKIIDEMKEKRRKKSAKAESEINKRVEELMVTMNVPTKDDIDVLSKKIGDLDKKVDGLKKSQE